MLSGCVSSTDIESLQQQFKFYVWNQELGQVRWMCSWDTTQEDVENFLLAVELALSEYDATGG